VYTSPQAHYSDFNIFGATPFAVFSFTPLRVETTDTITTTVASLYQQRAAWLAAPFVYQNGGLNLHPPDRYFPAFTQHHIVLDGMTINA